MSCTRILLLALTIGAACACGADSAAYQDAIAWMPITNLEAALGLTNVEHLADGLALSNATHSLHLFAGRRSATIDGTTVWLQLPPRDASTNDLRDVACVDYEHLLQPVLLSTAAAPAQLQIVLDAGHGGDDAGARSAAPDVREKDVALDIARDVAAQLTNAGQCVFLTRTNDIYESLGERTRLAAAHHAQLFVSIHANSSPSNRLAMGAETYILPIAGFAGTGETAHTPLTNACPGNRYDTANALLGFAIQRRCAPLAAMDRGLKHARFFVLKEATCPAVLIECGFLTNTNDATRLADAAYRRKFAETIAAGILDYAGLVQASVPATRPVSAESNLVARLSVAPTIQPPVAGELHGLKN